MTKLLCILSVVLSASFASGSDLVKKAKAVENIFSSIEGEELVTSFQESSKQNSIYSSMINMHGDEYKQEYENLLMEKFEEKVLSSFNLSELNILIKLINAGDAEKKFALKAICLTAVGDHTFSRAFSSMSMKYSQQLMKNMKDNPNTKELMEKLKKLKTKEDAE